MKRLLIGGVCASIVLSGLASLGIESSAVAVPAVPAAQSEKSVLARPLKARAPEPDAEANALTKPLTRRAAVPAAGESLAVVAPKPSSAKAAQLTYGHAGAGDIAGRPTLNEIRGVLERGVSTRLSGQNAVRIDLDGVRVIVNEDLPWKSTSYYSGK